jgi:hypothetical protein
VAEEGRRHRHLEGESTHATGPDSARALFDIRPRSFGRFGSRHRVCSASVQRESEPGHGLGSADARRLAHAYSAR